MFSVLCPFLDFSDESFFFLCFCICHNHFIIIFVIMDSSCAYPAGGTTGILGDRRIFVCVIHNRFIKGFAPETRF